MKYKWIILIIVMVYSQYTNAQMFEYIEYLDKEKISKSDIGAQVNLMYDNAEKKIKDLVMWELRQVERVQKEIEFESKDLPKNKIKDLKYKKFAELELLITTEEIDLDFWYLEQLDQLNDFATTNNLDCTFLPETQIQGRIIKMVIIHLMVDKKKYNDYNKKLGYSLDGAALVTGFVPGVGTAAATVIEIGSSAIQYVTDELIKEAMKNYPKYFGLGTMSDPREVQLTKIQNAKL